MFLLEKYLYGIFEKYFVDMEHLLYYHLSENKAEEVYRI